MSLRERTRPGLGIIEPCLPSPAKVPPSVTNGDGLAVFDLIRHKHHGDAAVLVAFDLVELDGEDLRRSPIEYRKRKLAKLMRRPQLGIALNEHYEGDGEIIFRHACKLAL
jgi:bifunctional non-homologous end joining protein LigD